MGGDTSKINAAVVMPQSPEALTCLLSCFGSGLNRVAPFDPKFNKAELVRLMTDATLGVNAAIVFDGEAGNVAREAAKEVGLPTLLVKPTNAGVGTFEVLKSDGTKAAKVMQMKKSASPTLMLSTSGTTGKARWVQQPATGILLGARLIAGSLRLRTTDVQLEVMPLHHIGGICCSLAFVRFGRFLHLC
jgi:acyl-CoA synthetase (AMP-forming)/AMP-acid ligase II